MNKQEAIEKIRSKKILGIYSSGYDYRIGYNEALNEAIYIIAQIDELESQSVPQLKEKLYTVEIPNPDYPDKGKFVLCKNKSGKVFMKWTCLGDLEFLEKFQLTEEEVKEKFDWAWQFAEEVEE